ncbi:MAG: major facilitator superfamily domain-containing protein 1 [bacterium]|nr:major facilitator superfamily domain-containing protein 1 [bacterium]
MVTDENNSSFFHPTKTIFRYTVLAFAAMLTLGSYFAYDIIGAIADSLMSSMGASESDVGTMYGMYSIAAIIAVFAAGFLIDRLGTRKASMIFSILVFLGAAIVAFAPNLTILYIGRFVFGAGSEPLVVVQSAILARWFKGKELALAFGIALTVSRIGTLFAFNTGELISSHFGGHKYALIAAMILCLFSLAANIVYIFLDKRGEKALGLKDGESEDKVVLKDIKFFKPTFWYVTLLCVTFYSAIFPFTSLALKFFNEKWNIPLVSGQEGSFMTKVMENFLHMFSTAGGITSIIIFASMVLAPFAGKLVDKVGKRATFMIYGSLLMIPAHLLMGITNIYPVIPMIALGAAFVLVPAAMWPSVPLVVKKERVGTAFGVMTAIQNIGLTVFPILNGKLREITGSYTASQIMFASLGLVGLIFAFLLLRANKKEGNILEMP